MENKKSETEIIVRDNRTVWQRIISLILRVTINHFFAFFIICITGWLLISLSYNFPQFNDKLKTEENFWHLFLRDIGIALFPIGFISLVYEVILRNSFIGNMTLTIKELMPGRFTHMRNSGLIDIYENLRLDKLMTDFDKLKNSEIRIIDIWMENFNRIEKSLTRAVKENNCKVKILLWNPVCVEMIENRVRALGNGHTVRGVLLNILSNLQQLDNILKNLENHPNKNNFEVKLYNSFIATSYISFGDECLVGIYLRERMSSMGTQLKVAGKKSYFYKELDEHFISQWEDKDENSTIIFDREKFQDLLVWFDKYLHEDVSKKLKDIA